MDKKELIWHTEERKVNNLIPYEGNPRQMSQKQKEDLEESLKRFNLMSIPVVNIDNVIVSGHQRLKILQILGRGEETIDVRVPNRELTPEELQEANLRENKNLGSWDNDMLANYDEKLLLDVGFAEEELEERFNMSDEREEDNYDIEKAIEEIKEPISKYGDLWQLEEHKLCCGDATKEKDIKGLMGEEQADCVFTDPPYNVNYSGQGKLGKIMNDNMTEEEFIDFTLKFIKVMKGSLKTGGVFYMCSGWSSYPIFMYAIKMNEMVFANPIVWIKNNTTLGWNDYKYKYEMVIKGKARKKKKKKKKSIPILYGWNGGKHYFVDTRFESDVWEIKRRASNTMIHPTQKPIALINKAIKNSSKRGELILDMFGGSGPTLISCEKLDRICRINELDPIYCDVIIDRWEQYTGKKAVKINK